MLCALILPLAARGQAMVSFSNITTAPIIPVTGSNVTISLDIVPHNGAEYVTVWLYYRVGTNGAFSSVFMNEEGTSLHFTASSPVPAQTHPGTPVQYYFTAYYYGPDAMSPTNHPADGPTNPLNFVFHQPQYQSSYTCAWVSVTAGASVASQDLSLMNNSEWLAIIATNRLINPEFRFYAAGPGGTNNWGDTDQASLLMPVFGIADLSASLNIKASGTNDGPYFLFRFNETNREYSAHRRTVFVNFDSWTDPDAGFGVYTNSEGWIISAGRTTTNSPADQDRVLRGRSCILDPDAASAFVRSPVLSNGVGEIHVWCRNWETNGFPATGFTIEGSTNGTVWRTLASFTNILTPDYLHFSYTLSEPVWRYVRISSATNSSRAALCIDELAVTEPGPRVLYSGVSMVPTAPTILDNPSVSITIVPTNRATNITAVLWYRAGTNGEYLSTPMSHIGGGVFQTDPPIPSGPFGPMQYYIQASFTGMRSGESVSTMFPPEGYWTPRTYTNVDVYLFQNYDLWSLTPSYGTYTNSGWLIDDARIRKKETFPRTFNVMGTNSACFGDYPTHSNSLACSPLVSNGIGKISFWCANTMAGDNFLQVEYSSNLVDWVLIADDSHGSTSFTNHRHFVNNEELTNVYIRVRKTDDYVSGMEMAFDEFLITPPPARVGISDVMIHPGYPSASEPVDISCTITSASRRFPAMNITAQVYYRTAGGGAFQGPIPMTKNADSFRTAWPIPAFPAYSTVEFYIESRFQGYHHDNDENQSPTYSPSGAPGGGGTNQFYAVPSTYHTYYVRPYRSSHSNVLVSVFGTNMDVSMTLFADNTWQGIVNFAAPAEDPSFCFSGLGYYNLTNYWDGTNTWGDAYQSHSELPFSSSMQPGGPPVLLPGTNIGQLVFRFDENTLSYSVQRCVFQNFDDWIASPVYFEESLNSGGLRYNIQNFDAMSRSSATSVWEDFTSWPVTNEYTYGDSPEGSALWTINYALITNDCGPNKVCQLYDAAPPARGSVRNSQYIITDGIGDFSFKYRCVDTNSPPTFYTDATNWDSAVYEAYIIPTEIPTNRGVPSARVGDWWIAMLIRYADSMNYFWYALEQHPTSPDHRRLYSNFRRSGQWALTANDIWVGANRDVPCTLTFYVRNYARGGNPADVPGTYWRVYVNGAFYNHYFYNWGTNSPWAPGMFGFASKDAGFAIGQVFAGSAQCEYFDGWSWANDNTYSKITTNYDWIAYYGYLTSGRMRLGTNILSRPVKPNIRTGRLLHGISRIQFSACRYSGIKTLLRIETSAGGMTNSTWTEIFSTNILATSPNAYTLDFTNITNSVYVRFVNDTTSDTNHTYLEIDDVIIRPDPSVALYTNFASGSAPGWIAPEGGWYVSNSQYAVKGYQGQPLSFQIQTAAYSNKDDLANDSVWTTWGTYTNLTNTRYLEVTNFPIERSDPMFIRMKHSDGYGSLIVDDFVLTSWHGYTLTDTNGWIATEAWITTNGAMATNCLELLRSRAYPGAEQYLLSPPLSNGIGSVGFYTSSRDGTPVTLELQYSASTNGPWTTVLSWTNSSRGWSGPSNYVAYTFNMEGSWFVRILHTTTNLNAGLLLDGVVISDYAQRDEFTWVAANALITPSQSNLLRQVPGNVKGAFLNHNTTANRAGGIAYTNDNPHIQSARLNQGVGEISFWYRNWGSPYPASRILIKASPIETNPPSLWTTIAVISNITSTSYVYYSQAFYDTSNYYVRICNDLSAGGRVCLDDVMIMAPYGADLKMRNLATDPIVPLHTNAVYVSVELYDFFLQPVITNIMMLYRTGTNPWASWASGATAVPMIYVGTNGLARRYRTVSPIPAQPIDSVVQYQIRAAYAGLFSHRTSPKYYTSFVNPPWYYPVDLNVAMNTNRTPYYFVFSCPPGTVWINEFNYALRSDEINKEYVEICGPSGVQIQNWRIELVNTATSRYDYCVITNLTMPAVTTNGFGFIVFGDPGVANVNYVFTNPLSATITNMPANGAIRLVRSMGAYDHMICYGSSAAAYAMTNGGYQHIDVFKTVFSKSPIYLAGTGGAYSNFTWTFNSSFGTWYTPGAENTDQTLTEVQYNPPPIQVTLEITAFWTTPLSNWMVFTMTGTSGIPTMVFYSTNLMESQWYAIPESYYEESSGVYTQWWAVQTNANAFFFRPGTN